MATFSNKDYSGPFSSKYEEDEALSGNRGNQARHMATQARHSQGLTGSGRIDTSAFGRNRDVFGNDQYEKATDNPLNSLIRSSQSSGAQAAANPTQSGLGSFLKKFGQDAQMGLSNILSGGAFQNDPNEQINRLVERGYSLSDAADFVNSTQRTMEQNKIQRALYGDTSDPSSSVLSGDGGTGDEGTGDEGTGDEGTGDEGTGVPSSTDFRFFGGYNPVSRSDVLVPSTFRRDLRTPNPRLDPIFPQPLPPPPIELFAGQPIDAGMNYGGGALSQAPAEDMIARPELLSDPNYRGDGTNFGMVMPQGFAANVTPGPQMPGQGQFGSMQELMEYQQQNPGMNLIGEYQRLRALEGGPPEPVVLPQRGIASLFNEQAPRYMYQGIMS